MATGGGAFKYYDRMKEELGMNILREDEMECLIMGTAVVPDGYLSDVVFRPRFFYQRDTQ